MIGLALFQEIKADLKLVEEELYRHVEAPLPLLAESSAHLLKAGGKRLRPAFALMAAKFYNYSLPELMPLAVALEMIHMATLVHDDVIDVSPTRRGMPTVRAKWGDPVSLHTGDYLFAKSLILVSIYQDPRIPSVLADVSVKMCQGEIQQIATVYDLDQTMKNYFYRIKCKTALLISASCELGAVAVNAPDPWVKALKLYGYYLGMAFQITDDILDMVACEEELGKPVGSDLRQGILTLPSIHALQKTALRAELQALLMEKPQEDDAIGRIISIIKDSGSIDFAFKVAGRYVRKAKEQLRILPDLPVKESMQVMADFIKARSF